VTADGLTRLLGDLDDTGAGVLVISPHLDDAVLSCGALLAQLAPRHLITVATVFTAAAPPPWSLPARRQLRELGGVDAEDFFAQCRAEDADVLADSAPQRPTWGSGTPCSAGAAWGRPTRRSASMPPAAGSPPATPGWPPR
jgi:hypothetical protein